MKNIFLFLLIVSLTKGFPQDSQLRGTPTVKSKIIYKDGSSETGFLWLASSEFHPRLNKDKKGKSKKIDYKKIEIIVTNPDSTNSRTFQYLNHNYNKFKIFVELIYKDDISIYVASKGNGTDLFYSEFDRETTREKMARINSTTQSPTLNNNYYTLPNGKSISIPARNSNLNDLSNVYGASFQRYILRKNSSVLLKVEINKWFIKKSKDYFKDCPKLIEDLEQKKITVSNLSKFIKYYKNLCINEDEETGSNPRSQK